MSFEIMVLIKRLVVAVIIASVSAVYAEEQSSAITIATSGDVQAKSEDGALRPLKRGSKLFPRDTVVTGASSRAQIRFADGTLAAVYDGSEYRLDAHAGGVQTASENTTLVKGALRMLTGAAAREQKKNIQIKSPVSTIGIRGTHVFTLIKDDEQFVQAVSHDVTVSNDQGSITVGENENFDFIKVKAGSMPLPALNIPSEISDIIAEREFSFFQNASTDQSSAAGLGQLSAAASQTPAIGVKIRALLLDTKRPSRDSFSLDGHAADTPNFIGMGVYDVNPRELDRDADPNRGCSSCK